MILLVLQVGTLYTYDYLLDSATAQQSRLYHELRDMAVDMSQLDSSLQASFYHEDLVHMKFGVVPPDRDQRKLGVGGPVNPDSQFIFSVHPVLGLRFNVEGQMEHLDNQISRTASSFSSIRDYMEQKYSNWRHIPSVSPATGRFTSGFGLRTHPVTGERGKMHYGIDISNNRWTPIYATADGIIDLVKNSEYFGNYVVVNHGNGYVTKYGHMEKPIVKDGQLVQRGQIIGYMGRTGRTTGVHVHYEVWSGGTAQNPINYVLSPDYTVE
ncbi:MAG TPA: M23 family metallopeptidase [Fibrobacteraceae bacterium]|nr:M23 family metallopeptidase [Fibrobacteraceae bacterium]